MKTINKQILYVHFINNTVFFCKNKKNYNTVFI